MKKPKKITQVPRPFKRRKAAEERVRDAFANVPNITNETVAEHREDVLAGARKYIYPLKHSRRRAVIISSTIFVVALLVFLTYTSVALYKLQSTSGFMYGVTKVIPFPVAKAGGSWVSYNSYLFELRHYMHYYETQQGVDFDSDSGKQQLENYKNQALDQVVSDAYVKQLAAKNGVKVSDKAVSTQIELMRSQNRLGTTNRELNEVLNEYWGWNIRDFRRSVKQQMLSQAVAAKLDTQARQKADSALSQVQGGADFATTASQVSNDQQYGTSIDRKDANLSPRVLAELFRLQPGQISDIIDTGYSYEIVKVTGVQDGKVQAQHIAINYNPINTYTAPLKKSAPPKEFITVSVK
jgi:hypothetical protein